jgi:ABC-2 type transport system permease protein
MELMAALEATAALARAWLFLVGYSLRRQWRSRKVLLSALLLGFIAVVVLAAGQHQRWSMESFGQWVVLRLLGVFYLPLVTLMFGTGAIGDDREERTLVYALTRPLARSGLYAGKLLAAAPPALLFIAGGLWILCQLAHQTGLPDPAEAFGTYAPALLFGALAYLAFFHLLGAAFRHSTLIAIAYVFFIEVFVGRVPGILKRVTINFYIWSMLFEAGAPHGLEPHPRQIFLPLAAETARWALAGAAAGFLLLGAWLFAKREYHDAA